MLHSSAWQLVQKAFEAAAPPEALKAVAPSGPVGLAMLAVATVAAASVLAMPFLPFSLGPWKFEVVRQVRHCYSRRQAPCPGWA